MSRKMDVANAWVQALLVLADCVGDCVCVIIIWRIYGEAAELVLLINKRQKKKTKRPKIKQNPGKRMQ